MSELAVSTPPGGGSRSEGGAGSHANLQAARVALVGNPNTGKTALFNAQTGGRQ